MDDLDKPVRGVMRFLHWWEVHQWVVVFWFVVLFGGVGVYFGLKE